RAEEARALVEAEAGRLLRHSAEVRYVRADGEPVWVSLTLSVVRNAAGRSLSALLQVQDITERKAAETELARRALGDPLTGLANRAALHDRLVSALDTARAGGPSGAVF